MPTLTSVARRCARWARGAIEQTRRDAIALRADRSGNVAIIFGIAAIPVFGLVGAAVDYSRANAARTAMQVALDAAALMVAKEAANLTDGQVWNKAKKYFNAQFDRPEVKKLDITFTMVSNGPGDFSVLAEATEDRDLDCADDRQEEHRSARECTGALGLQGARARARAR